MAFSPFVHREYDFFPSLRILSYPGLTQGSIYCSFVLKAVLKVFFMQFMLKELLHSLGCLRCRCEEAEIFKFRAVIWWLNYKECSTGVVQGRLLHVPSCKPCLAGMRYFFASRVHIWLLVLTASLKYTNLMWGIESSKNVSKHELIGDSVN